MFPSYQYVCIPDLIHFNILIHCTDVWRILMLNKCRKSVKNCQIIDIHSSIVAAGFWSPTVCQGHWLPWTYHRVRHSLEFLLHTCHCQSEFTGVHSKVRLLNETCWVFRSLVALNSCLLADGLQLHISVLVQDHVICFSPLYYICQSFELKFMYRYVISFASNTVFSILY